jgi:AraC-like DNA-binding protein
MQYREFYPRPGLARFVECFWTLEAGSVAVGPPDRILPDGCSEIVLNFGDHFAQHVDGGLTLQPRSFVVGQMTGPILISPTGNVDLLGIRFHPGGTLPFFRLQLDSLTNQLVELGSIDRNFERDLLRTSANEYTMEARVAAIETVLINYISRYRHGSWSTTLAAELVKSGGLLSVDQLATSAGISSRQLERRFLAEVGIGPKLLGRILRFQQVFRAVESCDRSWALVAIECGYYDQAHLIRDFNQFAQQTPSVLFAEQSALTESFTRKTRTSDFYNTR